MRLRRLFRYLTASLLFTASSAAFAAPTVTITNLGVLDATGTTFEQSWFRMFNSGAQGGTFTDQYNFSLQNAGGASGSVISFATGSLGLVLDSISLFKAGSAAALTTDSTPADFMFQPLDTGGYTLEVSGSVATNTSSLAGGAYYEGTIRSFASPAPEPAALAMGLAGLLAIGSVAVKRRKR